MEQIVALLFGLGAITTHELGHYLAMRECGVRIKEVALLGIPVRYLPSFRWTHGDTLWGVHLFVIGAYVEPASEKEVPSKGLWDQIYIYCNGITANIVYALLMGSLAFLVSDDWFKTEMQKAVFVASFAGSAWLIWMGRRFVALALPILALPVLGLIVYSIFSVTPNEAVEQGSGGPVAVISLLTKANSYAGAFWLAGIISLSLALVNLAPIIPLDGGKIFLALIERVAGSKVAKTFEWITVPAFLLLIVYMLGLDVLRIFKSIF